MIPILEKKYWNWNVYYISWETLHHGFSFRLISSLNQGIGMQDMFWQPDKSVNLGVELFQYLVWLISKCKEINFILYPKRCRYYQIQDQIARKDDRCPQNIAEPTWHRGNESREIPNSEDSLESFILCSHQLWFSVLNFHENSEMPWKRFGHSISPPRSGGKENCKILLIPNYF